VKKEKAAI